VEAGALGYCRRAAGAGPSRKHFCGNKRDSMRVHCCRVNSSKRIGPAATGFLAEEVQKNPCLTAVLGERQFAPVLVPRSLPGQHLVQHGTEAEKCGAVVDFAAAHLLRRHIAGQYQDYPRAVRETLIKFFSE
jgi:hypothetical protein